MKTSLLALALTLIGLPAYSQRAASADQPAPVPLSDALKIQLKDAQILVLTAQMALLQSQRDLQAAIAQIQGQCGGVINNALECSPPARRDPPQAAPVAATPTSSSEGKGSAPKHAK